MGTTHSYYNSDEQVIIETNTLNTINNIEKILTNDPENKQEDQQPQLETNKETVVEEKHEDFYVLIKNENIIGYTTDIETAREKIKELLNDDLLWAWNTNNNIKTEYINDEHENNDEETDNWLECKTYIKHHNILFSRWQILSEYIIFKVDEIKVCLNKENVEIEKIEKK